MATLQDFKNIISNAAADLDTEVLIAGPVDYAITEVWYDGRYEKVWVEVIEIPNRPEPKPPEVIMLHKGQELRRPRITDEEAEEMERKQIATDEMAAYEKYYEKEPGVDIEDLTPREMEE